MAEFCKECHEDMFGKETLNDFADISKKEDTDNGLYPVVLCEGCGPIQVDHTGKRVTPPEDM